MVKKHQVNQEEIYRPHFFADFSGKLPLPNFSFYKHVPPHASLYFKVIPMIITKVKTFLNVYNIIKQREKELTIDSSSGKNRSQTFEIDRNSRRNRFRWFLLPVRAVSDSIFRTLSAKKNISPFYDAILTCFPPLFGWNKRKLDKGDWEQLLNHHTRTFFIL